MKIGPDPRLPQYLGNDTYQKNLVFRINEFLKQLCYQLNGISEGKASSVTNAYTAAPTTGTYQAGDFVKNSAPAEAGTAGSKYVIAGWICTVSGTPGTWLECRFLTGN